MKLLSASQIRQWDQYTITNEPVSSLELMERAAKACTRWMLQHLISDSFFIFCGKGNNGGDGLAIARLLYNAGKTVKVFVIGIEGSGSDDFNANFEQLRQMGTVPIIILKPDAGLPTLPSDVIILDALFGTGLKRRLDGFISTVVNHLNQSGNMIISVDMPGGLLAEESSAGATVIIARHTLTFQCLKLAFLMPENEPYLGQVHILDINLHPDFIDTIETRFQLVNKARCRAILQPRKTFSHKGTFGHALLIAGSYGKMGAAVLSARACIKSGVGLLTCHTPECGVEILQTTIPEAMCDADLSKKEISVLPEALEKYSAIGIGPGIGMSGITAGVLQSLLSKTAKPVVLDADALNILSRQKELLQQLPENTVITPHPKEFTRIFGESANDFDKRELALQKAVELKIIIVLKGHYTFIALPSGKGFFNITGNAGMATGGSGDVLTGIITGLLAQDYTASDTAIAGVFLHGLAGDLAADVHSMEAMTAGDIIEMLGKAFKAIME